MTTLEAISYTFAVGCGTTAISLGLFGLAVRNRSPYIAPRCTARPKNTIYNPDALQGPQARGSPMMGWIGWCNSLSYDTLLKGVPGTGSRNGGLSGMPLKVNVDGIVLLRFQALCLKLTILITLLCLMIVLPINLTGRCTYSGEKYRTVLGGQEYCFHDVYNLTNYEVTTLANIPDLNESENVWDNVFDSGRSGILGRLYAVVLIVWIMAYISCRRMYFEWKTLLAFRRVYYLEKNIWSERQKELETTLLSPENIGQASTGNGKTKSEDRIGQRKPWIPHPEQRETVVNVALYSVLVGGLPHAPEEEIRAEDVEVAIGFSDRKRLDWQLEFATEYFDRCVPNAPGFSSSVAAITILPSAADLATAWGKWYYAAGKLRRLRFVRRLIHNKIQYNIESDDEDDDFAEERRDNFEPDERPSALRHRPMPRQSSRGFSGSGQTTSRRNARRALTRSIYETSTRKTEYYRSVLGAQMGQDEGDLLSFDFGPEQTSMYSREFAQSASTCCPNGCREQRLEGLSIDELRDLEKELEAEVHAANVALREAQEKAVRNDDFLGDSLNENIHSTAIESDEDDANAAGTQVDVLGLYGNAGRIGVRKRGQGEDDTMASSDHWANVEEILKTTEHNRQQPKRVRSVDTGVWKLPSMTDLLGEKRNSEEKIPAKSVLKPSTSEVEPTLTFADHLVRESTYAVVTFTSRQAAVAARQCLADGRGQKRWMTHKNIPVPPLADAPSFNICFCRGCCRPVSLSINDRQKQVRKYAAMLLLGSIYIFYTIPLATATSFVQPQSIDRIFPGYQDWLGSRPWFNSVVSGFLSGFLYTVFFSLCPILFKSISNCGSNASSVFFAEYRAMQYFWWFYVVTAFTGNSLSASVIEGFSSGSFGSEAADVLREIARTIPSTVSVTWLNWILVRSMVVLPLHFLLQMNTFMFKALRWNCCSRAVRGGGPGGTTPYRIYIDSGLVFMCAFCLAPVSPLVAPCALLYFVFCAPLLKRNLIYVYRPNSDSGGARWPFLFDMLISGMLVSLIILSTTMSLKQAYGPAFMAAILTLPIVVFRLNMRATFLRAYLDASLFHTAELDGLDPETKTSFVDREEYRQFLVDAHKAAYVPVCLAKSNSEISSKSYVFTSEPAVVVAHENDEKPPTQGDADSVSDESSIQSSVMSRRASSKNLRQAKQFGVSMRRIRRGNSSLNLESVERSAPIYNDDGSISSGLFKQHSVPQSLLNEDEESQATERPPMFRGSAGHRQGE